MVQAHYYQVLTLIKFPIYFHIYICSFFYLILISSSHYFHFLFVFISHKKLEVRKIIQSRKIVAFIKHIVQFKKHLILRVQANNQAFEEESAKEKGMKVKQPGSSCNVTYGLMRVRCNRVLMLYMLYQ